MRIRNLGVISEAVLPIGPGFTAITGETGAGKTMVVTGLGLLLGARADSGVVRSGAAQADAAGVWLVPDAGAVSERVREAGGDLEPAGRGRAELYIGRTVSAEGRSRASVGGRAAPAAVLTELAEQLVAVHGQNDQLRLRSAAAQRDALDRFGGPEHARILDAYRAEWAELQRIERERAEIVQQHDARRAEAEGLRAALEEIAALEPEPGEDARLAQRAERLEHLEELRQAAALAHEAVSSEQDAPDASGLLADARRALDRGAERDEALAAIAAQLTELVIRAGEISVDLSRYLADLDEEGPAELDAVQARRADLTALVRRHGASLDDVLELARTGGTRLLELDGDDDRVAELTLARDEAAERVAERGRALTAAREEAAARLGAAVSAELSALAMPDAAFVADVTPAEPGPAGHDDIAFLLAAHAGAAPRPLQRGASGGELSRVMLALEVVISAADPVPTFVFDEVDAGVGGASAIEIGRRLARLAETSQVIVVTHLAQVAAFAANHLTVVKSGDGTVTESSVTRLEGAAREAEMARLLSGLADSESGVAHARELLALGAEGRGGEGAP